MAKGWALIAASLEQNPWVTLERTSPGYITQEHRRL